MQRKNYSQNFKKNAVRLVLSSDKSLACIAREIQVNENTLYGWVKRKDKNKFATSNEDIKTVQQRLYKSQLENERLRKECVVLRQTAAFYFSQEL